MGVVGKIFSPMFSVVFLFFKINIQLAELCVYVCVCMFLFYFILLGGFLILIGIEQRKHVRQCQLERLDIFECGI